MDKLSMAVNPGPETVWLHYRPNIEAVEEQSLTIFQRVLSDAEYVSMIAARTGEMVLVSPGKLELSPGMLTQMIFIHHTRIIHINGQYGDVKVDYSIDNFDNRPQLTFQNCKISPIAQKKGLATRLLAEQVAAARAFGFDQIIDYADNRKGQNGHYTWPRLGFDKRLTTEEKSRLPSQFAQVTFLSDLIEQSEGLKWWRDNGFALELYFDTSLDSRSMRLLNEAVARLDQKSGYWDSGPDMPLRIERGETWRPRRDWLQRIWEYRQRTPRWPVEQVV